jgi:putative FmdB family regulatory protein
MPAYLYSCELHGEFEEIHSIKEKLSYCPKCKENNLETPVKRLIQSTSFTLSGGCWASDNYS